MLLGASTQTMVLLVVTPFVIWSVALVVVLVRRRRKVSLGSGRDSGLISETLPDDRPLASLRGGALVGGMGASWPFAVLDLHASALVVRSPQGLFRPMVVRRDDIGHVRIVRRPVGAALKVFDRDGVEIDFSFSGFSAGSLRQGLSSAGWLGVLSKDAGARN